MDYEPMDVEESENWNEHQPNNWDAHEPNNREPNEQEQNNWEPNEQEQNNWKLNEQEPNNWEPIEQEPNNWELNQQEPNEQQKYNWGEQEPYNRDDQEPANSDEQESNNWNEQEPNDWDAHESDYNEWDGTFNEIYRCYPLSAIDKSNFENGGKVIMPYSALSLLACLEIAYPMLFELRNPSDGKVTHCGVQEFTADWGNIYMPKWMMENMHLQEGNSVKVRSIQVPRATYVKLQPHTKDFLEMANPKAILEFSLRDYFCLTTGDTIMIAYNNKQYYIDIVETKPSHAVSIIETDCEVDFVQPLDYEEPEKQLLPATSSDKGCTEVHEDSATKSAKIKPFTGTARRLDGKPCTQSVQETSSSMPNQQQTENETKNSNFKAPATASRKTPGKLVFGSNVNVPKIQTSTKKNTTEESSQKKEEPKFQAFTGKKYSLMG